LLALEQELRLKIARRLVDESGNALRDPLSEDELRAADEAIAAWEQEGEDEQDMAAFRPLGPLQGLLADHAGIVERILDIRDRRLS
jgi:hypothetical protein